MHIYIEEQLLKKPFLTRITKRGFTLAEILIVITIIGVISSLTIPQLVQNVQDSQFRTAYKKAFADAAQAWISTYNDGVLISQSGWTSDPNNNANFTQFMNKFDVVKQCTWGAASKSQCWIQDVEGSTSWWEPWGFATGGFFIDKAGRAWGAKSGYPYIAVDTNGFKGPNQFGKDRWPLFPEVGNTWNTAGIPTTINPWSSDYTVFDANACYYQPCYYKSWLTGAK